MSWREKLLVTRAEAAEILGWSVKKVDRMIRAGKLRIKKEGRQVSILTASVAEYVEGATPESGGPSAPPSPAAAAALQRALARRRN